MKKCTHILIRGKNAGNPCGKSCADILCPKHIGLVSRIRDLPDDISRIILKNIIDNIMDKDSNKAFKLLTNIGNTCKEYRELTNTKYTILYWQQDPCDDMDWWMDELSMKQRLHLLLESGCQRCGCSRITKIHWPFPIRVCKACLEEITIRDYVLAQEYNVKNFSGRSITRNTWSSGFGSSSYEIFLIKDVEKHTGFKLSEYKLEQKRIIMERKRQIAESLALSEDDLKMRSNHFRLQEMPIITQVEREYYNSLASENFTKKYGTDYEVYRDELKHIDRIQRREQYDNWCKYELSHEQELRKKYDEYYLAKHKLSKSTLLIKVLHKDPYFSTTNIGSIIEDPNFSTCTTQDDVNRMYIVQSDQVKQFSILNKLDLSYLVDETAIKLARSIIKYPAKSPPQQSLYNFVSQFAEAKNLIKTKTFTWTWDDVIQMIQNPASYEFIPNNNQPRICPICQGTRIFKAQGLAMHMRDKH